MAYTVTTTSTAGGGVSGGGTYEQDQRFTLVATASDGYVFLKWVRGANSTHLSYNATYTPVASSVLINKDETYRAIFVKIVAEHCSVSRDISTYTITPDVGYVLTSLTASSGGAYMTISGNNVTVKNTAPQGENLVATASIRKKATSDGYNVYVRWRSQFSVSDGGGEYDFEERIISGNVPTEQRPKTATLRKWPSTNTSALSSIVSTTGEAPQRKTIYKSDGTTVSYRIANYLPLADGGNYWEGRNVGAKRSNGQVLVGWELRASGDGDIITTLPADGSTTIKDISELFDDDDAADFDNNSDGDYRVAFLTAVFGVPRSVSVSVSGAESEEEQPVVSASTDSALAGGTVALTAQTDNLATCEFDSWSVTDAGGNPVSITEGEAGSATFTMPDSVVSAVAGYVPKKFSISVSSGTGGNASVQWRASSDDGWSSLPQDGEVAYGSQVKFSATGTPGYVFDGWTKDDELYSVQNPYVVESVADDISLVATFHSGDAPQTATLTVVKVGAGYGKVDILGGGNHEAQEDGSRANADFELGDDVTLSAELDASSAFDGWYAGGRKISEELVYTFKFGVDYSYVEYTAKFGVSDDAIYEWEGASENKEIEWMSKVYTAPKPFDPVAARVDAAGYPVDLTVRTYSSPDVADALPVRDHELTETNPTSVQSQDGRRLPRMRPERYVRFTVKSTHEVDSVVIGTNMAEVN